MKYYIDIDPSLAKERAIEQWVLRWCRKYHPEAFREAEKFLLELTHLPHNNEDNQKS